MAKVLALLSPDQVGADIERGLRRALKGTRMGLVSVSTWGDAIGEFFPEEPAAFVVDLRMFGEGLPVAEIDRLQGELPAMRVILVGSPDDLDPPHLKHLIEAPWALRVLTPNELQAGLLPVELSDLWRSSLGVRVRARLLERGGGRPIPAAVDRALAFALRRTNVRASVSGPKGMAEYVGTSTRSLNRKLRDGCGLSARDLITWGRVLWAVHDLEREPSTQGEEVAETVGFSDVRGLSRALKRTLDVRIEGARRLGLSGAVGRFAATLQSPAARTAGSKGSKA